MQERVFYAEAASMCSHAPRMHGAGGPRRERRTLEADPFFCFHHVNAWEAGPDSVVMDCAAMRQGVDFGINFGNLSHLFFQRADWRAELTRLRLDLRSGQARAF